MTIRADITIDWEVSPRIIYVDSPSTDITMQDLLDTLRSREASTANIDNPPIVDAAGKEDLGGGVKVGLTVTLQNAKLGFEARSGPTFELCRVTGGNLVAIDSAGITYDSPIETTAYVQVVLANSSSATLQEQADIQYASFNGAVCIDVTSPYSGTEYPVGTPRKPVNNIADAHDIATERGFITFDVIGDLSIDSSTLHLDGHTFIGSSMDRSVFTIAADADVTDCEYFDAEVTGTLDGNSRLRGCLIRDLNYIKGFIEQCVIAPGTIVLAGTEEAHFLDCWSGQPGVGTPTIDMGGAGQALALRNYNGEIKLTNKTGPEAVSIDLNSGQVKLGADVTNGDIALRGVGVLSEDLSNGANVINQLVNIPAIWDYDATTVAPGSQGEANRASVFNGMVHIDSNGGVAGTAYPIGTSESPVNNMADALIIAANEDITRLHILEDLIITGSDIIDGYTLEGSHASKSEITLTPGCSTQFTQFLNCYLKGTVNGWIIVRDSFVEDLTNFQGVLHRTAINSGFIKLTGNKTSHILSCYSGVAGTSTPEVDFNGSNASLGMRAYSGGIKLTNKTGTGKASCDYISGQCIIDNTCTIGEIVVRGNAKVLDNLNNHMMTGTYNGGLSLINECMSGEHQHDIWAFLGLDVDDPMTISSTQHNSNRVDVTITDNGNGSYTLTRQ